MPPMNPEFGRKLAVLMRDYLRQQADLRSLAAILTGAETLEQPPYGWLEALKLMRETPEYRKIAEGQEQLFLEVERAADYQEIQQLIATMPPTQYPN